MRRDPRYPQYQPVVRREKPESLRNPKFGVKAVSGGVGGGGAPSPPTFIRIGGGHELRETPKVIGIVTSNAALPDFLPDGLEPNDTSEGDFPDAFGYGYLPTGQSVFVYARNAAHVLNALLGDPLGWTYRVIDIFTLPDQTRFNDPEAGQLYTIYQVGE